jgi:Pyridoxamine 5'-phosphate oxidase
MTWRELEAGSPELAHLGRHRLDEAGVALLGTLRMDGSPRISPVEPHVAAGHLLIGVMPWSGKARDLTHDPRCVLHSAVTGPDTGESELKLYGRAVATDDPTLLAAVVDAWWSGRPGQAARIYSLAIEQAVLVQWDTARGLMTLRRWSQERGATTRQRAYP